MKKSLRYLIALIFIVSGFVKAVDVKGFSFKLEEYFAPDVFNLSFFENLALEIAVFIVVLELILGLMLLLKIKLKTTFKLLITLCIFFAFLTFYSAFYHKVTDCGCFGDAIKLTPWQSFWKDIALLFSLIISWLSYKKDPSENPKSRNLKVIFGLIIFFFASIIFYGIVHEPLIDFRDYKIGTDLNFERKKIASNPSEYKTSYTLINTKTREEKIVDQDEFVNQKEYWQQGTPWQIQSGKEVAVLTKQGYLSSVDQFRLEDKNGNDRTEQILHLPKVYLIFSYKPTEISQQTTKKLQKKIQNQTVYEVSTLKESDWGFQHLTMDGTAIKTIARSNPFILVLVNGKITDKKSVEDFLEE